MRKGQELYKEIIDNLYDGVYLVDRERVITYWNKGAERITGYTGQRVVGHSCRENLLNHVSVDGVQLCQSHCPLAACMEDGKVREAEVFLHHIDGHRMPVWIRAAPLRDEDGNIVGAMETFNTDRDLRFIRKELDELRQNLQTDALTGIGNRQYLEGRLRAVIAEYKGYTPAAGLLFIDIDHFKEFNDRYGHEVGDKVLHMVAATLIHNMRKTDIVGRWGGEEFVAILYNVNSQEALALTANKLRHLVRYSHLDIDEACLMVTISIGATLLLADDTPESILKRADELMYQSKQAGRNRVSVG
jgi:diguanylate cyclase (GGDEF)-like protein/PAS domain S-box-containing protein